MKKCSTCKESKSFSKFHKDRSSKDGYSHRCKACRVLSSKREYENAKKNPDRVEKKKENQKKYYSTGKPAARKFQMRKKFIDALGGKCSVCGYDKCYAALEFHHKDPTQKDFNIAAVSVTESNWDLKLEEAQKCILICNRCHREQHHLSNENKYMQLIEEGILDYRKETRRRKEI